MTGKDLERLLVEFSQCGETHLDHLGRALRASGLMPTGGRGTSAPKIDHTHAANVLIGMSIGGTPLASASRVPVYRRLKPSWSGIGSPPHLDTLAVFGDTFGEAIEFMLLGRVPNLREVQIVREWPRAIIDLKDGKRFFYGYASFADAEAAGERVSPVHTRTILPVSVLSQIHCDLEGADGDAGELVGQG